MAREGKVIVKILKDVCSPIPYMGHSHERSLVHLLNPCSDVNRKEAQCGTVTFDYYQEGDNLVFKTKHNPNIVGYRTNVSITVVYWDTRINAYVHSQGDGNGGEFNKPNFFKQEGEYFIGKVNMEWFRKQNGFQYEPIAIHYNYVDLDNHEEEILDCYSEQKKPSEFVPENRLVKCSPILTVTRQDLTAGFNYHLVLSINDTYTNFKVGENVKYFIKYSIDDVEQPEELVYTHTTGGLVPNKEKDIFVLGHIKKVYFKFRIEYPKGYDVGYPEPNQTECYAERTEITPNGKPKPNPKPDETIKCSPDIIVYYIHQPTGHAFNLTLDARATVPKNSVTKFYLTTIIDGITSPEELVHTNTEGGYLIPIVKNIFVNEGTKNVKFVFRVQYAPDVKTTGADGDNSCSTTYNKELETPKLPDVNCGNTFVGVNSNTNVVTMNSYVIINKAGIYSFEQKLYWSDDKSTWTEETTPVVDAGNKSTYTWTLTPPLHKYYKGENKVINSEGTVVGTCSYVGENINYSKFDCSGANVIGSPFIKDWTYDSGLSNYTSELSANYEVIPHLYWSSDQNNWTEDENSSSAFIGGDYTNYSYRINTPWYDSRRYYKAEVQIKDKRTGSFLQNTCPAYFENEPQVQDETICDNVMIMEEPNTGGDSNYKASLYVNFQHQGVNPNTFTLKVFYRYYDEVDFKPLKEINFDFSTYNPLVPYEAHIASPRDKYYLKAELWSTEGHMMCSADETLIRKE